VLIPKVRHNYERLGRMLVDHYGSAGMGLEPQQARWLPTEESRARKCEQKAGHSADRGPAQRSGLAWCTQHSPGEEEATKEPIVAARARMIARGEGDRRRHVMRPTDADGERRRAHAAAARLQ